MNQLSGYTEIELNGEVFPFKFGTNCWALFCEMRKIEFSDVGNISTDFLALRDLFYCAHTAAMRSKGESPKVNIDAFGDLLDETPGIVQKLNETMLTAKIMGFSFSELAEAGSKKK